MKDQLLKKTLYTVLSPYLRDIENEDNRDSIFDEDSDIELDDLKFITHFTEQCIKNEEMFSIDDCLTVIKTFWYICDSVLSWDLLCTDMCRTAILLSIDACNTHAVCLSSDSHQFVAFTQLSGLLGYIFQKILSHRDRNDLIISDEEIFHYEMGMKNLACDFFAPRMSEQKDLSSLQNHLKWWKWDILDRVEVYFHPSPKLLSLLLTYGATPKMTTGDFDVVHTTIDLLHARFGNRIEDPPLNQIGHEERQDIEDCIRILYDYGGRSTLPINMVLEEIQILGQIDVDDSDMETISLDSGNEEEN